MSYRTNRRRQEKDNTLIPLLLLPVLLIVILTTVLAVHFTTRGSTLLVDPCGLNLCENNSTCVNTTNTTSGFLCTCLPGFNGTFCENAIEPVITVCDSTCEYGAPQQIVVEPAAGIFRRNVQKGSDGSMYVMFSKADPGPIYINYIGRTLKNGTIDTTFGINGYITIISPTNNIITDFLPLDDGAFVCFSNWISINRRLWRANSDGTIDVNFPVVTPVHYFGTGIVANIASSLVEGKNGGFFFHQMDTSGVFYIDHFLKYTPTGLDVSYGTLGRATHDLSLLVTGVVGLLSDSDSIKTLDNGSLIVFCSFQNPSSRFRPGVVKLTPTGAIDVTFGTNGFFWDANAVIYDGPYTPRGGILSDGSIIWAGWGNTDSNFIIEASVVFKLTPTGQLNTTWGVNGYFVYQPVLSDYPELELLSVEPCDGLVIGVSCYVPSASHILRLDSNGILNPLYPIIIPGASGTGTTSVITGGEFVGDPLYYHLVVDNSSPLTLPCV